MNLKKLLFLLSILACQYSAFSQLETEEKNNFWTKVRYGGRVNLGFGNNGTNIVLAPVAIYSVSPKVGVGASVSFGYSNFRNIDVSQFNYGASAILNYYPIREILMSAELEQTFVNRIIETGSGDIRNNFNFPALYLGLGYRLQNISFGFRYDVLYNDNRNIYNSALSPFIGVFF